MPRKKKATLSLEEQAAQFEERCRKFLTKEVERDNKAGHNVNLAQQLRHNIWKHRVCMFPSVTEPPKTKRPKKDKHAYSESYEYTQRIEPDVADGCTDADEAKIIAWSKLLQKNMLSEGFALPILYRMNNPLCTTVTFGFPCLQKGKTQKLNRSDWVFPGFTLRPPHVSPTPLSDAAGNVQNSSSSLQNSSSSPEACFHCSCCSKSVSFADSIGLSDFVQPSEIEDACDCICSKVLRRIIKNSNISLEKLAAMSPVACTEEDTSHTCGYHLGFAEQGSLEIMQFGCADKPDDMGIVVGGKCVTCKGHKACSHVKQYRALENPDTLEVNHSIAVPSSYDHHLGGSWGSAPAEQFEARLKKKLSEDRNSRRLAGLSSTPFTLHGPAETKAAIAGRPHLLAHVDSLQDPQKDGFHPKLVSSNSMLFTLHGVKLNMKVNFSHTYCTHRHTHARSRQMCFLLPAPLRWLCKPKMLRCQRTYISWISVHIQTQCTHMHRCMLHTSIVVCFEWEGKEDNFYMHIHTYTHTHTHTYTGICFKWGRQGGSI